MSRFQRFPSESTVLWLISLLLVWAFLRGFATHPEPYGLGQYFYTYEAGFLIRGLIGTLVHAITGPSPTLIRAFVDPFTTVLYFLFIAILLLVWRDRRPSDDPARRLHDLLFLALLSGPLMIGIGATRGFLDTINLAVGLLAYLAFQRDRYLTALLLLGIAILIHEQIAFLMLPVLGWLTWNRLRECRVDGISRALPLLFAASVITLIVVDTGKGDTAQMLLLIHKVRIALEYTDYFERWVDPYFTIFAAHNKAALNLTFDHLERLTYPSHQIMLVPSLVFIALGTAAIATTRRWGSLLVYLLANLLPFGIMLFALDVHRYLFHIQLSTFLLLIEALRVAPVGERLRPPMIAGLLALTVAQLPITDYPVVELNARNSTPLYELVRNHGDPGLVPESRVGTRHY
ncbi:MAG: hypothetical protein H6980_03355 [Gammaproteobacteria bacterium]|nr:hypothetical protein [Gammaproteobacteria bacterium]